MFNTDKTFEYLPNSVISDRKTMQVTQNIKPNLGRLKMQILLDTFGDIWIIQCYKIYLLKAGYSARLHVQGGSNLYGKNMSADVTQM